MENNKITYRELMDLGFIREETEDDVLFRQTGYHGFNLSMEFENIDRGISTGCIVQNDYKDWDFKLYIPSSGNIVGSIDENRLHVIISELQELSQKAEQLLDDLKKLQ